MRKKLAVLLAFMLFLSIGSLFASDCDIGVSTCTYAELTNHKVQVDLWNVNQTTDKYVRLVLSAGDTYCGEANICENETVGCYLVAADSTRQVIIDPYVDLDCDIDTADWVAVAADVCPAENCTYDCVRQTVLWAEVQ
jgi:hypothetical protein